MCATLKATAKISTGEWCEWDLTLATVQGTVMQTLIPVGTQCPGLWWKKYHLHRSESSQKERRTGEAIVVLLLLVSAIVYPDPDSIKIG